MSDYDSLPTLFRLDEVNGCLWQGTRIIRLHPKSWAVLQHLVTKRGQRLSSADIHAAAWPGKRVSEANVKVQIRYLRKVLKDSYKQSRFIATHHGGYSFTAHVHQLAAGVHSLGIIASLSRPPSPAHLLGRNDPLDDLYLYLNKALAGQRQVVFVSGEAGVGKTTRIRAFRDQLADMPIWVAAGQCGEHYGKEPGEAYAPVLDALGGGFAKQHRTILRSVFRQYAPSWLPWLPALAASGQHGSLPPPNRPLQNNGMARELAQAIDILTTQVPFVLILDDLQWSDPATFNLIALLARRREPARFLLIGAYRPEEIYGTTHPLRSLLQDLKSQHFCHEVDVLPLTGPDVHAHLTAQFPRNRFPAQLAALLNQRTSGNPSFLVDLLTTLKAQGALSCQQGTWRLTVPLETLAEAIPIRFRSQLERHIHRLTAEERELLAAASVVGERFPAMIVAQLLGKDVVRIEELCEALVEKRYFLLPAGVSEEPAGASSTRYRFRNRLLRDAWLFRLTAARRQRLQQRLQQSLLIAEIENDEE